MIKSPIIFTSTFYRSPEEIRFSLALETCRKASEAGYSMVVVDGSPEGIVRQELALAGATVFPELERGMGPSRRQAAFHARELAFRNHSHSFLWMEPEKPDLIRSIPLIQSQMEKRDADLIVVGRTPEVWSTYPEFQRQTESEAVSIFNKVAGTKGFDPFFGPVMFNRRSLGLLSLFDPHDYGLRDDYVCHFAICNAMVNRMKVESFKVGFTYPPEQKVEEEGSLNEEMRKKRIAQRDQIGDAYKTLLAML